MSIIKGMRSNRERGASLVEFAIVAPFLLILLFGIIDFGRYMAAAESVRAAAREGARFGINVGDTGSNVPHYVDCDEMISAAADRAGVVDILPTDVTVEYDDGTSTTITMDCLPTTTQDPALVLSGHRLVVTVEIQFSMITPLVSAFFPSTLTISSTDRRTVFKSS